MKNSLIPCLMALLFLGTPARAQFLKKLGNKISNKVENAVTENIANKAASESEQALNKIYEIDLGGMEVNMGEPVANELIPEAYDFTWKYVMGITTDQGEMEMVYRFRENSPYFGMQMPNMANMFMVMDQEREISVIYMDGRVHATKMSADISEAAVKDHPTDAMSFEKIAGKTILGYECDGYRAESDEHIITMYITDQTGVGFSSVFQNQKNLPKNFDPTWLKDNSMLLEMQMEDKKDPGKLITMKCSSIEKTPFRITK